MHATPILWIVIAFIVGLIIGAAAVWAYNYALQRRLRRRFGPEYGRMVAETGSEQAAAAQLRDRERRVSAFSLHALRPEEKSRYAVAWKNVQTEFVDDPRTAVSHADGLLKDVMQATGYPMSDFEQRSADLSVEHPGVVQNYRAGHAIVQRCERGEANTEELRQAMVHYRALFNELVNDNEPVAARAAS
jgi:hypothetical protein